MNFTKRGLLVHAFYRVAASISQRIPVILVRKKSCSGASLLLLLLPSIHEKTIYGVNVMGAIRKLFSYWFSLKWEENGVFWRLLMLTFFFFSPLFSASLPFSLSSFIVNRNRFQNTEFFNVFRFKNSDPCKGSQKNPRPYVI